MSRAPRLLVAAFLALPPPAGAAAGQVTLIVSTAAQARAAARLVRPGVAVLAFDSLRLGDPIERGRIVASLQAADRVISATGGRACGWLGREVEGVPIQCFMPYNAPQVLDFARSAGWRRIAAVHITGYENIFARLRSLARERGIELAAVKVDRLQELTAALPPAIRGANAVWIVGDPLFTQGPAFDYLVETSLTRRVPLIAPGFEQLSHGVFLGAENDAESLGRMAISAANAAAAGEPAGETVSEAPGGRLQVNKVLARRWGVRVPEGRP